MLRASIALSPWVAEVVARQHLVRLCFKPCTNRNVLCIPGLKSAAGLLESFPATQSNTAAPLLRFDKPGKTSDRAG